MTPGQGQHVDRMVCDFEHDYKKVQKFLRQPELVSGSSLVYPEKDSEKNSE